MPKKKGDTPRKSSLERKCTSGGTNVLKFPEMRKHSNTIYFCSFKYHRGIIKNPEICQDRKCRHYREVPVKNLINNPDYFPL